MFHLPFALAVPSISFSLCPVPSMLLSAPFRFLFWLCIFEYAVCSQQQSHCHAKQRVGSVHMTTNILHPRAIQVYQCSALFSPPLTDASKWRFSDFLLSSFPRRQGNGHAGLLGHFGAFMSFHSDPAPVVHFSHLPGPFLLLLYCVQLVPPIVTGTHLALMVSKGVQRKNGQTVANLGIELRNYMYFCERIQRGLGLLTSFVWVSKAPNICVGGFKHFSFSFLWFLEW